MNLSGLLTINRNTSGLHLRAYFDPKIPKELVLACARNSGLSITGTQAYYLGDAPANEFLIQFAHIEESQLKDQIEQFASQLKAEFLRLQSSPQTQTFVPPVTNSIPTHM